FFFLGSVIAYAFWSAVLPQDIANAVFADQIQEVERLAHPLSLFAFSQEAFQGLFLHNFWVLLLVFVFSLLYGIGSLYILLWNASLVGVFIGGKTVSMGISGFLSAVLALLPHGVFEVSAYFVASIAGGLLSAAIMRRHYARLEFRYVLRDVAILGVMAAILLVMAAIIESAL
ncbi:MAG TPA: stage II sporulation protein M, partial [Candidatus Norongarragalinales archaeon]|nr:stage II sporulation protein M [Candidatus Norongarragalinales archaeon]